METEFKSTLKSIKMLYIIEDGVAHDYHVMPFELMCERIHLSDFNNGWGDYLKIEPNMVMIHTVSNFHFCEEIVRKIQKINPQCPFLILTEEVFRESVLHLPIGENSRTLFLPITFEEMVRALKEIIESNSITYFLRDQIFFEPSNSVLIRDKKRVPLTSKENKLLLYLIHNSHRIVSYEEIENYVWGDTAMNRNTLTTIISNLRKKAGNQPFLENHSNQGYKILLHNLVVKKEL
ncbi:MAG: winged helix-turn-helix domain-containing protein [Sulfuricurvum sp.]|jgi:DNA-binding response OmpR family regulator|uniref:winged helix-turn-helix domain-containing protein n=1 Tax=Sulfuricurvum sp. TaxID=2025608 RepID=UPI0025CEEFFF|nr:winged helix-turn-helix domain-containing protein [Sulfuricurvum sp.]MCK9373709.1 winged helix-turn-helix domain-containing protein [Sulfuricurvum sp.]